mgnify:CR=1 FL=1
MKITIHKFKRLEKLSIDVPAQITGGNGLGKTTILEAISFCLTGKNLDGSTFDEVYDNRVDLKEAFADVSFFDDYGNEYRRKVEPIFETNRQGEEKLKILRNTTCTKNKIDVKDFASEFDDFYRFGTGFFFTQKEADQRSIFIDLMKSLLPDFDVKKAQEEMKSLKKTQREAVDEIKSIRAMLKKISTEEAPEIPEELGKKEEEYQNILESSSKNSELISQINAENNATISAFRAKKTEIENSIFEKMRDSKRLESDVSAFVGNLEVLINKKFEAGKIEDPASLPEQLSELKIKLEATPYFTTLEAFAKENASKNPIVVQNIERLKALRNGTHNEELSDVCPACLVASKVALSKQIDLKTNEIKAENRALLEIDMREANNAHLTVRDEFERVEKSLNSLEERNRAVEKENEENRRKFNLNKTNSISSIEKAIEDSNKKIEILKSEIATLKDELDNLGEPKLKELPTEMEVSEELKEAHQQYVVLHEAIVGANAVNANNAKIKDRSESEIKENQNLIAELDSKIVNLQSEISDYFSNLDGVVKKEFCGKIEIGVQLQEYVITRDEYKDCFKIVADGKIFPSECNGAFKNNVKLQLLRGLQKLRKYHGITIFDNAEANTTEKINGEGLNLVIARATDDKELIIS